MGFFGNLLRGAQNFGNQAQGIGRNLLQDVSNIQTPIPSGGQGSARVTLGDIGRNIAPAATVAFVPTIKTAADLVGTIGGWTPGQIGKEFKAAQGETDNTLDHWTNHAQQQLGVTDKNAFVQAASIIPKIAATGATWEVGGAVMGAKSAELAASLAKSGVGVKALSHLGEVASYSPETARMLTNYVLHPELDSNLFKATLDGTKALAGKGLSGDSAIRLAKAGGGIVGGTVGFNALDGANNGKTAPEVGHNIKMGLVGGNPVAAAQQDIKAGKGAGKATIDAAQQIPMGPAIEYGGAAAGELLKGFQKAIPHVAAFLKEAAASKANPEVQKALQGVGEHFISEVHAPQEPVKIPLHAEGTPLSEMNPAAMQHHQEAQAEMNHGLINANQIVAQKQEEAAQRAPEMKPLNGLMQQKMEQYKAAKAAHDANLEAHAPTPGEMAQMERNAVATPKPQATPEQTAVRTITSPKETGSAHENQAVSLPVVAERSPAKKQADTNVQEIIAKTTSEDRSHLRPAEDMKPADPRESAAPLTVRKRDDAGNVTHITNGVTGEVHTMSHDGSPISNYKNELIRENAQENLGSAADIAQVHSSRQRVLDTLASKVNDHLTQNFTAEEREVITHVREGALKPSEVSPKIAKAAEQLNEVDRLHYSIQKEASPKMGEINNGTDNYVPHKAIGKQPAQAGGKVGLGRFSIRNGAQQGRSIVKLEGPKGKTLFGDPEAMGMQKQGNGTYVDKFGTTFRPTQATVKELNENGFKYETDAAKLFNHSSGQVSKVANNMKLSRNLTDGRYHGNNIIPRQPGEVDVPRGYKESHLPGMENHWISKSYHSRLYTGTDAKNGITRKTVIGLGKVIGAPSRAVNQLFFAENSAYHQLINEAGQAHTTMGAGSGKGVKSVFGPLNTARTAKYLGDAHRSIARQDDHYVQALRDGLHLSPDNGTDKMVTGAWSKLKAAGHAIDLPNRFGHFTAKLIGDNIRMSKYLELRGQGMSGLEAAKTVNGLQGNYGNLSKFEKEIVTNYVQFYPFFKHQVTSIAKTGVGAVIHPTKYLGAATTAALTYAAYTAIDKQLQKTTGNEFAHVTKGGMLGLIDDVKKAPGQMAGYTDKGGVKHPGVVPSIVTKRFNPVERNAIEQATGKDLATNQKFDTSQKGRLDQAGKSITPINQNTQISSGRRSPGELALNVNSVYLPHGAHTPAAPALRDSPYGGLVNVQGMDSKATVDDANRAKEAGGSKLLSYQYARNSGDNSLEKFWKANPNLDPKSNQFEGYKNPSNSKEVVAGKNQFKEAGGSSLTYMQAVKLSGNSTYDKFFTQHPELDPTSPSFQGMKKSGSSSSSGPAKAMAAESKYAQSVSRNAESKVRNTGHAVSLKHSSGGKMPGQKRVSLSTRPKASKTSITPAAPGPHKVSLAAKLTKQPGPKPVKLKLKH